MLVSTIAAALGCACSDRDGPAYDWPDDAQPQVELSTDYSFLRRPLSTPEIAELWDSLPFDRIELARTTCLGTCPDYTVTYFRGSGEPFEAPAVYEGRDFVDRVGSFDGGVTLTQFGRLCEMIEQFGFFELREAYALMGTDAPTAVVTVDYVDGAYAVRDYGLVGPPELAAIQFAIDAVAAEIEWTPATDE